MKKSLTTLLMVLMVCTLHAQEIRCNVTINSDQIEGSNKQVYQTLKQSIEEYINQNRWTTMQVTEQEKIECNLMLIVKQVENEVYQCEMQLQSRRPVYGTTYSSPILNFKDNNFCFHYQEYESLEWQQNQFTTNLTAMLAYYCYLVIGYDMDSFSRLGGQPFFQQCEDIVSACQSASMDASEQKGWLAFDSNRNRYALINNLMDEAFKDFRNYLYEYHRLGLDEMAANPANGRARIAKGIDVLRTAYRARPATYVVNTFLDAKGDELVNLFQQGTDEEKKKVYDLLVDLDPTRQTTYDKIYKK